MRNKLIFISPINVGFVRSDIEICRSRYEVICLIDDWKTWYKFPYNFAKQILIFLWNLNKLKAVVIAFGGYWSLVPSILGKYFNVPVYIILHGTDSVAFKEIGYGNLLRPLLKYFSKLSYKYAKRLLPVSDSLISTDNGYFSEDVIKLGIANHFPDLKLTYTTIHNGLDMEFWKPVSDKLNSRSDSCITVIAKGQEIRKGLKLIEKLALKRPDYDFYIAGCNAPDAGHQMPNIKYLGFLKPITLREHYRSSKFYFQLSIFEGFGLSLCEAMLCGCVPIGSHVNMIPEIIGDSGYILERMDENELLDIFNRASSDKFIEERSLRAMKTISEKYPIALRKELLLKIIESR